MAKNPDITALAAYAGSYEQALITKMYLGLTAATDMTLYTGVKSKLQMTKLIIKNQPKPYTGVLTSASNDISFTGRELDVTKFQRDITIEPDNYRQTFMQQLRGAGENANNKIIPFGQLTWETIMKDMAYWLNQSIYLGVGKAAFSAFDAGTVYHSGDLVTFAVSGETKYFHCNATTTAGQSPSTTPAKWDAWDAFAILKGLGAQFLDLISLGASGGGVDQVATGSISSSTAYAQFKELWRSQTQAIKLSGAFLYCSQTNYEAFVDNFETNVSKYTTTDAGISYLPTTGQKCIIKPVDWLSGSNRLICTPKENLIVGTDLLSDMNSIATEEHPYTLDAGITGVLGVTVRDPEILRINDQA